MIILPILTTSIVHFSLKGWENELFELGSERTNAEWDDSVSFECHVVLIGRVRASVGQTKANGTNSTLCHVNLEYSLIKRIKYP